MERGKAAIQLLGLKGDKLVPAHFLFVVFASLLPRIEKEEEEKQNLRLADIGLRSR